jgi:hypothetical protein
VVFFIFFFEGLQRMSDSLYFNEYIDGNIPYKFQNYTSQSNNSRDALNGLGDINNNYRFSSGFKGRQRYNNIYSKETVSKISIEITKRLNGVHPEDKNIIIPVYTISSVIDAIYNKTPHVELDVMIEMVINYIVNQVKTDYETTQQNNKLSIWVTNYDVTSGMQRFSAPKLNNKTRLSYTHWTY